MTPAEQVRGIAEKVGWFDADVFPSVTDGKQWFDLALTNYHYDRVLLAFCFAVQGVLTKEQRLDYAIELSRAVSDIPEGALAGPQPSYVLKFALINAPASVRLAALVEVMEVMEEEG